MPERQPSYREILFAAHGMPPWSCYFCGNQVGLGREHVAHHIDGDHENDSPENIAPAHTGCHTRSHLKGRPRPDIAERLRGRTLNAEHRSKIAEAHRGRALSEAHRAAISKGRRANPTTTPATAEHRAAISEGLRRAYREGRR